MLDLKGNMIADVYSTTYEKVRRIQDRDVAARLVAAYKIMIIRHLDYCNSVLAGLSKSTTALLHKYKTLQ